MEYSELTIIMLQPKTDGAPRLEGFMYNSDDNCKKKFANKTHFLLGNTIITQQQTQEL